MNHIQRRAGLVGLAVILSLAGCSAAPSTAPAATPEASAPGGPATGLEGYEGLPDTFPSDVPLIEGDVLYGIDVGTGWSIVIARDDIAAGYSDAEALLTAAGFAGSSSTTADGSFGAFDNDRYTVQITATDSADYGPSVQYVVIKKG
ncbi:MAG: hypothetical protein J0J03_02155 [Leifsonia sp.]|nr:hypothetical protein [Leifsonia sp.]